MENNNNENLQETVKTEEIVPPKKKELSQKQIKYLNNTRVKALKKKKKLKILKWEKIKKKNQKPIVIQEEIQQEVEQEVEQEAKPEKLQKK